MPTANLPESLFPAELRDVPTGVYVGWASVDSSAEAIKAYLYILYKCTYVYYIHMCMYVYIFTYVIHIIIYIIFSDTVDTTSGGCECGLLSDLRGRR